MQEDVSGKRMYHARGCIVQEDRSFQRMNLQEDMPCKRTLYAREGVNQLVLSCRMICPATGGIMQDKVSCLRSVHVGIMKENLLCKRMFHARTVVMQVVLSKIRCNARESVMQDKVLRRSCHTRGCIIQEDASCMKSCIAIARQSETGGITLRDQDLNQ